MSDDEKKGIMLAHAEGMNHSEIAANPKIVAFLDDLTAQDRAKDPNTPGFKVVDFGVNDQCKPGEVLVTGGEDVKETMGKSLTFVSDGGPARYIFAL